MKNVIKIVTIIFATAFCLQIASVFAMENNPVPLIRPSHKARNGNFIAINQDDGSKVELWQDNKNGTICSLKIKEFPVAGTILNDDAIAINDAGTRVAIATNAGIYIFDVSNGELKHTYPKTEDFNKLSFTTFTSTYNGSPSHIYENLNIERGGDALIIYEFDRKPVPPSLINKILQHKITKIVGVCALGAAIVGGIGYLISKIS